MSKAGTGATLASACNIEAPAANERVIAVMTDVLVIHKSTVPLLAVSDGIC